MIIRLEKAISGIDNIDNLKIKTLHMSQRYIQAYQNHKIFIRYIQITLNTEFFIPINKCM